MYVSASFLTVRVYGEMVIVFRVETCPMLQHIGSRFAIEKGQSSTPSQYRYQGGVRSLGNTRNTSQYALCSSTSQIFSVPTRYLVFKHTRHLTSLPSSNPSRTSYNSHSPSPPYMDIQSPSRSPPAFPLLPVCTEYPLESSPHRLHNSYNETD
jgi:hypothetical protein